MKHQPFEAFSGDYVVDVIPHTMLDASQNPPESTEVLMCVDVSEGFTYITKAQCMKFFGLVEAPTPVDPEELAHVMAMKRIGQV